MAEHGIDGVFLMRNANELAADNDSWNPLANLMRISDEVVDGVKVAAEAEGRVWALMYVSAESDLTLMFADGIFFFSSDIVGMI